MAENRCATFYTWIYDSETVCRILLKKNPQIANMVFYLWIFFHSPVSITTLATAKKLKKKHRALWERARVPLFSVGTVSTIVNLHILPGLPPKKKVHPRFSAKNVDFHPRCQILRKIPEKSMFFPENDLFL